MMRTHRSHARRMRLWALGPAALLGLALLGPPARAANFTVTSTADAGAGSLRAAIAAAAASTDAASAITFDPATFGTTPQTITLTSGELAIGKNLTITGTGAGRLAVSGNAASRVFHVTAGTVAISGLTVTNGTAGNGDGGGVLVDSGATLNLSGATVQGCTTTGGSFGGGLYSSGTLTLSDCTVAGNTSSGEAGGVFNFNGALTLTRCAVVNNTGGDFSGGVGIDGGTALITNCTVAGNTGNGSGGAGFDIYSSAQVTLVSCTVAGNTSNGSTGGGGILKEFSGSLTLQATIIAGNTTTSTAAGAGPDLQNQTGIGVFTDGDSNLVGDNTGGPTFTGTRDQVGTASAPVNPGFSGGLQDNGGPTPTVALGPTSPAIDGDFSAAPPATDQRGLGRPQGARADVGAFERDTVAPVTSASLSGPSFVNGFFRGPVTVTLSVADATAGSSTFFRVDSGSVRTYNGPFTVSGDFQHFVTFYSIDPLGNAEGPAKSVTFSIDGTPPATTITSRLVSGAQEVTLAATDNFSGVSVTFFRVDSGPLRTYTAPFTVSGMGQHLVTTYSIDRAGNAEGPAKSLSFSNTPPPPPDTTAPVTAPALSGPSFVGGFFRGPVTVTLNATDNASGVASTFFSVDSGPRQTYGGPFTVSGDFQHLVVFYSVDRAGNTEGPAKSVTFGIDTTPPSTTITSRAVSGGREVTLTATDNFSGVSVTFYRVDSGPLQTYTAPFVVTGAGPHLVTTYSQDRAGNVEGPAKSLSFSN